MKSSVPTGSKVIAAIAWFIEAEYPACLELFDDSDSLHPTYGGWVLNAQEMIQELETEGVAVRKVVIHVEEFKAWCDARSLPYDATARSRFASETVSNDRKNEV